ncbi:MAG: hypothetical protein FJ385_09775 [Verrucomicrobia bacterium]|nr:hypothetical protein [Verrucomicrobiota bacterium]
MITRKLPVPPYISMRQDKPAEQPIQRQMNRLLAKGGMGGPPVLPDDHGQAARAPFHQTGTLARVHAFKSKIYYLSDYLIHFNELLYPLVR